MTGLKINTSKSVAFTTVPYGKTWILANTVFDLGGPVPVISPSSTTKYLGGLISPWKGIVVDKDPCTALNAYFKSIGKYPLKPHQRVQLAKEYVVPKILTIIGTNPLRLNINDTCMVDRALRKWVRRWLKLPECTANAFIYTKACDGGLGLPCIEDIAFQCRINSQLSLIHSSDILIRLMAASWRIEEELGKNLKLAGSRKTTAKVMGSKARRFLLRWRDRWQKVWKLLSSQGTGVDTFKSQRSNTWIGNPECFREAGTYIRALKLRGNVYPSERLSPEVDQAWIESVDNAWPQLSLYHKS